MLHVTQVKYIKDYSLWLEFDDGTKGYIDLSQYLNGVIFKPLQDIQFFKQVVLDKELETITWPNGADFAPEFLKDHLKTGAV